MKQMKNLLPGILLCLLIAAVAWLLGRAVPVVGGAVFAIVLGIIAALFKRPALLDPGVSYTGKKLLQYSIILLGFEMNMARVLTVGAQSLYVMLFTLTAAFLTAFLVGRAMKLPAAATTLIGVGTSICGGSAIAATAPVIKAKDEDVAQSISVIFLFNIVAVFLFPALGRALGLTDTGFGMWAGTAVNDTSSVVAAASAWSEAAGNNTALSFATIVKLTRTLMIVPITLILALYTAKKSGSESGYSFRKVFPWFVLGFIAVVLWNSFIGIPDALRPHVAFITTLMLTMGLAAMGLNANVSEIRSRGLRPLLLALSAFVFIAGFSLVLVKLLV